MSDTIRRRDWYQIIRIDLVYAGVSIAKIGHACKRDPKTVEHWTLGGEPKDSDAQIVLALYRKFCPEKFVEHMKKFDPNFTPVELPPAPKRKTRVRQVETMLDERQMEIFGRRA